MNMENLDTQTELSRFVKTHLQKRKWSLRTLAAKAELSPSSLSNLLRGKVQPNPDTLNKIAAVLEIDAATLLRLAGHLDEKPKGLYDASVIELARRIEELPTDVRYDALDTLGNMLDTIYRLRASSRIVHEDRG